MEDFSTKGRKRNSDSEYNNTEMKIRGHGNDRLSDIVEWKNCPSTRRLLGVENMVIDAIIVD